MSHPRVTPPLALFSLMIAAFLCLCAGASAQVAGDPGWPREIEGDRGTLVVYQPQLDSFKADVLTGRAAFSLTPKGKKDPIFGAFWFTAKLRTDRDARTARLEELDIHDVRFPGITAAQQEEFAHSVEAEVEKHPPAISLDRLLAAIAVVEQEQATAEQLRNDPPKIVYASEPAVLLLYDGEPIVREVPDSKLERVVNTPLVVVRDPGSRTYYFGDGVNWYGAADPKGPWRPGATPPRSVLALAPPDSAIQAAGITKHEKPHRVIVAIEPTELVQTDGAAQYVPLVGNELLSIKNTEEDLFRDIPSQKFFLLLSGRWYASASLEGPWSYIPAEQLPESFARIPEDSDKGRVLASVPGTPQAREAVIDAQIPQTAAIKRGAADLEIAYDGTPQFEAVTGTDIEYAINSDAQVLKTGGKYYACAEGVWYVAAAPRGPWEVSSERPAQVEKIPPSNPCYNTKYVYIYDTTPDVVYVGYTPAYLGCYVYGPTIVYGTGYVYYPWIGPVYYYPRPYTWGFCVHYSSWNGWVFGFGPGSGYYHYSMSWGYYAVHHGPYYGYWGRPGGWYGAGGYRPIYIHHTDINININNRVYSGSRYRSQVERAGGARISDNLYQRPGTRDRVVATPRGTERGSLGVASDRPNNVYAGKDGSVYRRDRSGWEQSRGGTWQRAPGSGETSRSQPQRAQPGFDPARLDRERQARDRGEQRTESFQRSGTRSSRSATRTSRSGGSRRR